MRMWMMTFFLLVTATTGAWADMTVSTLSRNSSRMRPRIKMVWGERRGEGTIVAANEPTECPMPQPNDLSGSLAALDQDNTLIAVIEMSQASWLVGAIVPGVARHPLKKLAPDAEALLRLLQH